MQNSWYRGQVTEYKGQKSEVTETTAGDKDRGQPLRVCS